MRRPGKLERGLTFVTVLIVLALAGAVYWVLAFGGYYWDNHELKQTLRQAGNMAYSQKDDRQVRGWILRELDAIYGYDGADASGHKARLSHLEFDDNDLVLERTDSPPLIKIYFHYGRTFTLPIFGGQRHLEFNDRIEQDLSTVKW